MQFAVPCRPLRAALPLPRSHLFLPCRRRSIPMASQAQRCIYLDYNATTPIWAEVADAMVPFLKEFGNPSSDHPYGRTCKAAVELARSQVAALVGAQPHEIFFCSCGSEADNWAIWGSVAAARRQWPDRTPHVVTTAIEHPAVLKQLESLQALGLLDYTAVPVDSEGIVDVEAVQQAFKKETCLVTCMHSNNEVGSLQPIQQLAALAWEHGVLMHTDGAQSIGKVHVDVKALGVDMLTIVGHKFGAPKGIAALYIKDGTQVDNFLHGGGQELGRRAGTENVLLAVGLGKAAEISATELEANQKKMAHLRDELQKLLVQGLPEGCVRINGPNEPTKRLPNTLSISIKGIVGGQLLSELSEELAASAGSACHTGGATVSGVLGAMGVPPEWAVGTLRLSVGRHSSMKDVRDGSALIIKHANERLAT